MMKTFALKKPVFSFLVLTYFITYLSWFLPVMVGLPKEAVFFLIILGMLGPMIASFFLMFLQSESKIRIGSKTVFYTISISSFLVLMLRILVSTKDAGKYYIEYSPYLKGLMPAFNEITWVGWLLYFLLALIIAIAFSQVRNARVRENFFQTLKIQKDQIHWYLIALFFFPLLSVASKPLSVWMNFETNNVIDVIFPVYLLIIPFLSTLFFTGGTEEFGWRGFMQKELQKNVNPLFTALIVAFFWTLWHLPLHYNGLYSSGGFIDLLPRFAGSIPIAIIFAWFYNKSRYSILTVLILHTSLNFSIGFLSSSIVAMTIIAFFFAIVFIFTGKMWQKKDFEFRPLN